MPVQTQLQQRRGTAASWTSTNPTLAAGEIGFETDTGKFKIGNGSTAWAALAYSAGATAVTYLFNATSGQTTFSGADANGLTLAYTVGAEQVYLNGVLQVRGSDYTATNGTSIVLASGALTSDVLNVIAYSAMTITDTYTQAQADAKFVQQTNNFFAGKNKIINGDFGIWQRGTSIAAAGSVIYGADRFAFYRQALSTGATVSRQAASLTGFEYSMRLQRDSGNTNTEQIVASQVLESSQSIPLAGKTVTISFWAKAGANLSSTSSTMSAVVSTGTGTNQSPNSLRAGSWTSQSSPINSSVTITTTWARYQLTATLGSTITQVAVRLGFTPTGTAGANDWIEVTGIQLEVGSIATAFQTASGGSPQQELAMCQRYYYRQYASLLGDTLAIGNNASTTTSDVNLFFPVPMRTFPTALEQSGTAGDYSVRSGGVNTTCSAIPTYGSTTTMCARVVLTVASGLTTGNGSFARATSGAAYFGWSAEL